MAIIIILGFVIGSFLNVLIDRLPEGEQVISGRSHCDHCHRLLEWYELIPVLSFILQKGRSRCCRRKLSFQYPIIELLTAVGFGLIYQTLFPIADYRQFLALAAYLLMYAAVLVIFVADLKTQIIPDEMLILLLVGIALRTISVCGTDPVCFTKAANLTYIWSSLGAGLFFLVIFLLTRGRGLGFGDVKLAFLIGLFSGFPDVVFALYAGFLTGAVGGVILVIIGKKKMKSHIAFGPFLIMGVIISILFKYQFLYWWKGII